MTDIPTNNYSMIEMFADVTEIMVTEEN